MKTKHLIHVLLGGFLALHVCPKSTAQSGFTILGVADTFNFSANDGGDAVNDGKSVTWTASGAVESPVDYSSMHGSVHLLGGVGILTGSGNMGVNVGSYLSKPSISVSGVETIYVLIQVTGVVNYRLVSTVSAGGAVQGGVTWIGHNNSGAAGGGTATVMESGTLETGEFQLKVVMSNGGVGSGHGTWSYSLSLIPADIAPGKLSAAQKADFYDQYSAMTLLYSTLYAAAVGTDAELRNAMASAALSIYRLAQTLLEDYLDPADTNYTALAQVAAPAVTPLAAGGEITQSEADAYNLWQTNLSQSAGYGTALTTSLDREQGAATAGSSYWATSQMNAAVQFEAQLAALLDQEPGLRSNVVAQFQAGGFAGITVTTNDASDLQLEIITNGLPADLLDALTALGVDSDTITNVQYTLLTTDPGSMAGGFPGGLVNTNLDSAAGTLAADMRDASLMLINASLLPGGQFRFDLPTEPGYTYTIQFSENLAEPAGWTTLFATNATTRLLSFTNTAAAGAPVGFYRASHD
jgi:hypothetical protein